MQNKTKKCTCYHRQGDDYYCSVHGGEGGFADLRAKGVMLVEKLGNWIAAQNDDVQSSAAMAFGSEMETLGRTLAGDQDERREAGREIISRLTTLDQIKRDRQALLEMTNDLDEHPEGYDGPCWCKECISYG